MTPFLRAVYDELVQRAAGAPHEERSRALREAFSERCGAYPPDHPAAESREAAAWEDVLVRGGLALALGDALSDPSERDLAHAIASAQRGVFVYEPTAGVTILRDLWSGGRFLLAADDHLARELALQGRREVAPCQGRIVGTPEGCTVLPGVVFHPPDAANAIESTLATARSRRLSTDAVLDGLLRMEHTFRSLSRVKIGYAYRAEALGLKGARVTTGA